MSWRKAWDAPAVGRWAPGVLALVALVVALVVVDDFFFRFVFVPLPWMLAMAAVGYLPQRRPDQGLLLALAVMLADQAERGVGAQALACLALPLFALTRRPRFATLAGAALLSVLLVAVELKKRFAGSALTWQDVRFFFQQFADNVGVFASQPTLVMYTVLVLGGAAALLALAWRWDRALAAVPVSRATNGTLVAFCAVLVGLAAHQLGDEAFKLRERGALVVGDVPTVPGVAFPVSRFLATVGMEPVWQPLPVDTADFRRQLAQSRGAAAGSATPADIVLFLQESQFNPATLSGCPPQLCALREFGADARTHAHGLLRVHTFGGGTWLSEFAAATGVPHTVFGTAGDFAPFNVAQGVRHSFPRSLKAAGYRTVAVYPVRGGMMNARLAYGGYGFDRFYDAADLGLTGRFDTHDGELHQAALRVLAEERKHGQPVYLFVVTIFNHGEHGIHMERVPPQLVAQASPHFTRPGEAANVADYVWRTREFERVMSATRNAILEGGRPAVVGWFGDHQPPFGSSPSLRARVQPDAGDRIPARYQTWYRVDSNVTYLPVRAQAEPLDLAFLSGVLAQAAGLRRDDWLAANVTARQQCDGLLTACRQPQARDAYLSFLRRDLQAFDLP